MNAIFEVLSLVEVKNILTGVALGFPLVAVLSMII